MKGVEANSGVKKERRMFFVALLLLIGWKILLMNDFSTSFTDSDQAVMWAGTSDYSKGEFHEPRFYGQSYNSMLESVLAVPLFKLGVPLHITLPIVTMLLVLLPFFLLAVSHIRKNNYLFATLILLTALVFPLHYDLLSALPRGFVTGIAVASLMLIFIDRDSKMAFFLTGFFMVMGWSVNAGSVLLSVPLLFLAWKRLASEWPFYLFAFLGSLAGLCMHLWVNHFYVVHPETVVHSYSYHYHLGQFLDALKDLKKFLGPVTPFSPHLWFLWLVIPLAIGIDKLSRQKNIEAVGYFLFIVLILAPLGFDKVNDGSDAVFYSVGRMYLALPVCFAVLLSRSRLILDQKLIKISLVICIAFTSYKWLRLDEVVKYETERYAIVAIRKSEYVISEGNALADFCKAKKVDLVLVGDHPDCAFYAYGCGAIRKDFPPAVLLDFERRYWRVNEVRNRRFTNVLLIDRNKSNDWKSLGFIEEINDCYLLRNNTMSTEEMLGKTGFSRKAKI